MSGHGAARGGAPVGLVSDLDAIEAAAVLYLRQWHDGPHGQSRVFADFAGVLGHSAGRHSVESFAQICALCSNHGRRPLMRHARNCTCLGADEACFARFIGAAGEGEHEDAMLMATLLVRVDMAPILAGLARDFALALRRLHLAVPRDMTTSSPVRDARGPLH